MMRSEAVQAGNAVELPHPREPVAAEFDAFYRGARPSMVRLAHFLTGSAGAAEETVQDSFVQVLQRWDRIDDPAAYLRTCVVNRARSRHRHRLLALEHLKRSDPQDAHRDQPDELLDALAALPRRRREVVVLRFYEQLSLAQIARVLRTSEGNVKSSLHRGLAQLKEALQ
jgi:RNA polymerase sigma-70 factor (sigma-E family)